MRGSKVKRLRKLGLKPGPKERTAPTPAQIAAIEMIQEDAREPYVNARREREGTA